MTTARGIVHAILAHLCAALLITTASADQPSIPRIGVLAVPAPYEQGLREGLAKLCYAEARRSQRGGGLRQTRS